MFHGIFKNKLYESFGRNGVEKCFQDCAFQFHKCKCNTSCIDIYSYNLHKNICISCMNSVVYMYYSVHKFFI